MKLLVISDIHGNAEALRAVMRAEPDADHAIFLGDALLSGPQANETLHLLMELNPDIAIMGNHDEEILNPSLFANWPDEWIALNEWILERLDADAHRYISGFTQAGCYQPGGLSLCLHHGELEKPANALPDAPDETFQMMNADGDHRYLLFGHTHIQFTRQINGLTCINPGSVGQPRCGKLQACYGVITDGDYAPRQVTYDPSPWLDALDEIKVLKAYPKFHRWLREGLLDGYGIGKREPWTRYAARGYQ